MEIPEREAGKEAAQENAEAAEGARSEAEDENRRLRRLQMMMNMVMSVLYQEDLSLEEATELAANAKRAALALFPDKELAFDLIYRPRMQRVMRERFHLQ